MHWNVNSYEVFYWFFIFLYFFSIASTCIFTQMLQFSTLSHSNFLFVFFFSFNRFASAVKKNKCLHKTKKPGQHKCKISENIFFHLHTYTCRHTRACVRSWAHIISIKPILVCIKQYKKTMSNTSKWNRTAVASHIFYRSILFWYVNFHCLRLFIGLWG